MRIQHSQVQLAGQHALAREYSVQEEQTVIARPGSPQEIGEQVTLSAQAMAAQQADSPPYDLRRQLEDDPMWRVIKQMIKQLTGRDVDVDDIIPPGAASWTRGKSATVAKSQQANTAAAQPRTQVETHYRRREEYSEIEKTQFAGAGKITTSDGQVIDFKAELNLHREYHEVSETRIDTGAPSQRRDPLVVNFDTDSASLGNDKISFDLDGDGTKENISFLAPGSGFLALDRNGDGKINDGTELFGTQSGDGFADLAQFDDDGNGWIDENDAVWAKLKIWTRDASGGFRQVDLKSRGIGAIYLGSGETTFSLTDQHNREHGLIRRSGVYLKEDGKAGTVQQLDLTV
ncbi:hypothetical protein [Chitinimonas sp.]|uniref:hypothetical protein n=1 Tax=Chitinimonas sp. TaxID=1934313 RepID=UPI002F941602